MVVELQSDGPRWLSCRNIPAVDKTFVSLPGCRRKAKGKQRFLRRWMYGVSVRSSANRTMAPLLPPGTFVQIDAKQVRVRKGSAKKGAAPSPYARPIYF